jgi:hypothetical protein
LRVTEANLPAQCNGKVLQFAGGGYNGRIPATSGLAGTPTPLAGGFLTFASDSGHRSASADDAASALDAEALRNFGDQNSTRAPGGGRALRHRTRPLEHAAFMRKRSLSWRGSWRIRLG